MSPGMKRYLSPSPIYIFSLSRGRANALGMSRVYTKKTCTPGWLVLPWLGIVSLTKVNLSCERLLEIGAAAMGSGPP